VKEQHFLREVSMGFTHIARTRLLRQLTIGVAAAMLVVGFAETLLFAMASALDRSPSFIGVMGTCQGVGAIAGGIVSGRLMRKLGELRLAGVGLLLFGVGDALWLVPRLSVVLPAMAVAGLGIVWAIVALGTAYQRYSPGELQGRVSAAANMLFSVPQTLSIAAGAALITLVDYRVEIVAMGIVFLFASGYLLTRRREAAIEVEPALAA
jgi:MFS family permease